MTAVGSGSKFDIIHFTTVHTRTDTRIAVKQTASIASITDEQVALFVQDGQGFENIENSGVKVVDVCAKLYSRSLRLTIGVFRMWQALLKARPKIAHFHDPELIPIGILLKLSGIKVIYDVHEDVPRQILAKFYLPAIFRQPIAWAVEAVEWIAGRYLDAIVPATPKIGERFPSEKTVVVQNFPVLKEMLAPDTVIYANRPLHFAYVGCITKARGAIEMVKSIGRVASHMARLRMVGSFTPPDLQSEVKECPGWEKTDFLGWANRSQVANLLCNVRAGLVVLHPTQRYPDAYPVKMFEYMAAGLPVIASDFPLWREIIDGNGCGLLVDPLNPDDIAYAMQWIIDNPIEAEDMGKRGRQAVEEKYNWELESKKLLALYKGLLV